MTASLEKVLGGKEASLALLQVLADNSFDAVLITDASLEGKNHIRKQGLQEAYGLRSIGCYRKDPAYSPGGGYRQESHRAPCWRPKSRRPI